MPTAMRFDDEIRVKILEALIKKGSVNPNMRQIKRHTGYHKATIKSSLDFLEKEGLLKGYGPKIDFRKFGYCLEAIVMLKADMNRKELVGSYIRAAEKDPHMYWASGIAGPSNWNIMTRHFYKDIESFHRETQKKYNESIPNIYDIIRDKQVFYAIEPHYKNESRTESILKVIKAEKGLE